MMIIDFRACIHVPPERKAKKRRGSATHFRTSRQTYARSDTFSLTTSHWKLCYAFCPMAKAKQPATPRHPARRIVSLAPNATSILCEVGARNLLVGVSKWCADVAPVEALPKFGDFWHLEEASSIHALHPDLVVGSVPSRAEAMAKLLEYPLNFFALHPLTISQIERDIRQLGALTAHA